MFLNLPVAVVWKLGNSLSEFMCFIVGFSGFSMSIFRTDPCFPFFMSFNSIFQSQLGCRQDGKRSETVKGDATLSTTTVEALHGQDPLFRYFFCLLFVLIVVKNVCPLAIYDISFWTENHRSSNNSNSHNNSNSNSSCIRSSTECGGCPEPDSTLTSHVPRGRSLRARSKHRGRTRFWLPAGWLGGSQCSQWETLFH